MTARRLALIVGSQCEALPRLPFLPANPGTSLAAVGDSERLLLTLHDALLNGPGEWAPAVGEGQSHPGLLLSPTAAAADTALRAALTSADEAEAVLLVYFAGHGSAVQLDRAHPVRHLLHLWNTVAEPVNTEPECNAWDPYELIDKRRPFLHRLVGLVMMVDACFTGTAKTQVEQWADASGGLRSAFLGASSDEPAWDGCFTRTLLTRILHGVAAADHDWGVLVPELRVTDLEPLLQRACRHQTTRVGGVNYHDRVLWIARNRAADALGEDLGLDDRTRAFILRRTGHYVAHDLNRIEASLTDARVVVVLGGPGSGKSTLVASLLHPPNDDVPLGLVQAAAFLDVTQSVPDLARVLRDQLDLIPGFRNATRRYHDANVYRWETLDDWTTQITGPLSLLHQPVRLALDALDRLDDHPDAGGFWRALHVLISDPQLTHVSLLTTSRHDPALPNETAIPIAALDDATARRYLDARGVDAAVRNRLIGIAGGNWLVLDLVAGLADRSDLSTAAEPAQVYDRLVAATRGRLGPPVDAVLAVLTAAGSGPVLPVGILVAAVARFGHALTRAELHTILGDSDLYSLIERVHPGQDSEHVGLFHQSVVSYLEASVELAAAHRALLAAIDELAPAGRHDPRTFADEPDFAYAFDNEPNHLWRADRLYDVPGSLAQRAHPNPHINLGRWTTWTNRLILLLGPSDRRTLVARRTVAVLTGKTGDAVRAFDLLWYLESEYASVFGGDDARTLAVRVDLAYYATLDTRADRAEWLAWEEGLLDHCQRVLGAHHRVTLSARSLIADSIAVLRGPGEALDAYRALLRDQETHLGDDDEATLLTRGRVAHWTGIVKGPKAAQKQFRRLRADEERVFGRDHPHTLNVRSDLAYWTWRTGDKASALAAFTSLLTDLERVLGTTHPNTVLAKEWIEYLSNPARRPE